MTAPLDPRRHPIRPDLAATHLRDRIDAPRYASGEAHRVVAGRTPMRNQPDAAARCTSEALFGEPFTVYDRADGWAWGQNGFDGYVGWVTAEALAPGPPPDPTHRLGDLRGFLFPAPDLKEPPLGAVGLGARVTVREERAGYGLLADGGWISLHHLRPLAWREPDPVATAERLLGVPYLWGGRTPWGIDCSGLVQLALDCAGVACPRDSDMQRDETGTAISADGIGITCRRGDLVFFPGHVGLMLDDSRLLHATAHRMTVSVEPLEDVALRAGGITGVRRLD